MTERHPRTMKMLLSLGLGLRLRSPFRHSVTQLSLKELNTTDVAFYGRYGHR